MERLLKYIVPKSMPQWYGLTQSKPFESMVRGKVPSRQKCVLKNKISMKKKLAFTFTKIWHISCQKYLMKNDKFWLTTKKPYHSS